MHQTGGLRSGSGCAAAFYCVPSMAIDWEVQVLWEVGRNDPSEPQGENRERLAESSGVTRPVGRRTETGYEAGWIRANGQLTVKLSATKRSSVNPALVQGQPMSLTWGGLA